MTIRATDCHMHIFADQASHPFAEPRSYTVPPATVEDYWARVAGTGIARVVVVQPSAYATDNRCTLAALDAFGDAARGVAVIDPDTTTDADLSELHAHGVRGVRLNLRSVRAAAVPLDQALPRVAGLLAGSDWHIQIFCDASALAGVAAVQATLDLPLIFDHCASIDPLAADAPMQHLARLIDGGAWVKLSGSYRISSGPDGPGVVDLVRRIHAMAPDRMVWASDWPHTPKHHGASVGSDTVLPYQDIDTAGLLRAVEDWFPDESERRAVLETNPARLYGFTG